MYIPSSLSVELFNASSSCDDKLRLIMFNFSSDLLEPRRAWGNEALTVEFLAECFFLRTTFPDNKFGLITVSISGIGFESLLELCTMSSELSSLAVGSSGSSSGKASLWSQTHSYWSKSASPFLPTSKLVTCASSETGGKSVWRGLDSMSGVSSTLILLSDMESSLERLVIDTAWDP